MAISKILGQALSPVPQGVLFGLTMSTAGSSTTMTIAAGLAADSTGVRLIKLASSLAKTTSAWAAGAAAGALDTGSVAINTWYHWFIIENPATGAVDVLCSLSATAPTLPTGYTLFRRIGAMKTNGSSQWIKFLQADDDFNWDVPVSETNFPASLNNTSSLVTLLGSPGGVKVKASLYATASAASGCTTFLSDPDITGPDNWFLVPATQVGHRAEVYTNASAQVKFATNASVTAINATSLGYRDTRGRNA